MTFAVRQVKEKHIEQQMDLHSVFINLTKAFDTVNREALWTIPAKLGCPCKFTALVRLFVDNMTGQVLCNGDCTNSFNIPNGAEKGCVFAPILFNLLFLQALLHTVKDLDLGVYIRYRSDGSVFDLRRLSARTKTVEKLIIEALYAGDCVLMAHRENPQIIVDRFAEASRLFGLAIRLGKTEVLVKAAPEHDSPTANSTTEGVQLKCVESFKYLGSTVSSDGSLDS